MKRRRCQQMRQRTGVGNVPNSEIDPALVDESRPVDLVLQSGVNRYLPRPRFIPGVSLPFRGCEAWL
jgi:hypothetical protein